MGHLSPFLRSIYSFGDSREVIEGHSHLEIDFGTIGTSFTKFGTSFTKFGTFFIKFGTSLKKFSTSNS